MQLISKKTKNLTKQQKLSICKLKNTYWHWTLKNQYQWFKENVRAADINNILKVKNKIVGYTLLRKRKAYHKKKILRYLYFDTTIIKKSLRNKGYGEVLMHYNNKIINRQRIHSFLTCPKKLTSFYSKYEWKILSKNKFKILDHNPIWFKKAVRLNGMVFKLDKKYKSKINYYLN
jgi:hypothetical protein